MLKIGFKSEVIKLLILVYPYYGEWMDNILNIGDMRKFKFQKMPKNKVPQQNGIKSNQSEID